MTSYSTLQNLRNVGWSTSEAKSRANAIDSSREYAAAAARGIPDLHRVGVEFSANPDHPKTIIDGIVIDGRLQVGGVLPSGGMLGRVMTQPWRSKGGDLWTMIRGDVVAVLGNGTEVLLGEQLRGCHLFVASDKTFDSILAAALELTPAI